MLRHFYWTVPSPQYGIRKICGENIAHVEKLYALLSLVSHCITVYSNCSSVKATSYCCNLKEFKNKFSNMLVSDFPLNCSCLLQI